MSSAFPPFDINDPSTYTVKSTGLPSNFSYNVRVDFVNSVGVPGFSFVNVHDTTPLTEEQIISTAQSYAIGTGRSGIAGEITDITITEAFRKV